MMKLTYLPLLLLTYFLSLVAFPGFGWAALGKKISPELRSHMTSAWPSERIPVIVRMKAAPDIPSLAVQYRKRGPLRAAARAHLIRTLKSRGAKNLHPLMTYLANNGMTRHRQLWLINGAALEVTSAHIEAISMLSQVQSVDVDEIIKLPAIVPTALPGPVEPNISLLNAPGVWSLGYTGQGVTLAFMDSGVDMNHPDIAPRWRGGPNSWFDPNEEHPLFPYDNSGHGTEVTGLALGGNNSGAYIGVAPDAQWIGVKIFADDGNASSSVIHEGFQWLLDPDNNPETDDAPDIVNNAWSFASAVNVCDATVKEFQPDIQALQAAGISVLFAAGNTGPDVSTSVPPANYPESFAVGSVGVTGGSETSVSPYSARGPSACDGTIYPEVVAPGDYLLTSTLTHDGTSTTPYASVLGSSFSVPQVSGVVALLLSAYPDTSVSALEAAIKESAADLGPPGADNAYGYGLVDALAAYDYLDSQQLTNSAPVPPQLLRPDDDAMVTSPVQFAWLPASDADGDAISQFLVYWEKDNDSSTTTLEVDSISTVMLGGGGLLLGALIAGFVRRRRYIVVSFIIAAMVVALVACGGGGSGESSSVEGNVGGDVVLPEEEQSITVSGLTSGTTYQWKMVAKDSLGNESESTVRSFTVGVQ